MSREYLLTTIDNPWNPFTQEDEWRAYDWSHGYYTEQYFASLANTSMNMSESEYDDEANRAMDEVIEQSPLGIHIKVTRDTVIRPISVETYLKTVNEL